MATATPALPSSSDRLTLPPHVLRQTGELLSFFLDTVFADVARHDPVCSTVARALAVEHKQVWSQLGAICPLLPLELLNAVDVFSARQTLLSAPELLALSPALRDSFVEYAEMLIEPAATEDEVQQTDPNNNNKKMNHSPSGHAPPPRPWTLDGGIQTGAWEGVGHCVGCHTSSRPLDCRI